MLRKDHACTTEERQVIVLNSLGQQLDLQRRLSSSSSLFWEPWQGIPNWLRLTILTSQAYPHLTRYGITSKDLLLYWNTDEAKKISHSNKDNHLMLDDMHTLGCKSFAILRHELRQQDPDKQEPSQAKVYKESRKRSFGRTYKTSCEKAKENIAKMDAVESSQHEDDLKKKANKPDFIFPEEFISSVTTAVLAQIHEANPGID
uniref:Uncharacterized protein n=1 Tax=Chenopodium quinoa TaxID=63459 RepID=A0A803MML0_CHEQI